MRRPTSLYPIPGSKRHKKYACLNTPPGFRCVGPFMGGAARELLVNRPVLGEINLAHRQIASVALSAKLRREYVAQFNEARNLFIDDINLNRVLQYVGIEESQKALKQGTPAEYALLTERWKELKAECFARVLAGDNVAGLYSFLQRSCFGNVMRLAPTGTHYNVSWHIEKLSNAIAFDPQVWCDSLAGWNPIIYPCWQDAIASIKRVSGFYVLLDPPYWTDGSAKMTPCYPGHSIGTKGIHNETYELAVMPLINAMQRRFPLIRLCNYEMPRLEQEITQIAFLHGYSIAKVYRGRCRSLGNSAGRFKHGNRVDKRPKPWEAIYEFRPVQQLCFSFH